MKHYIVSTHLGDFETMAKSPEKAINNVRFRLFGRSGRQMTMYWTAAERKGDSK